MAKSSWGKVTPAVETDPNNVPKWSLEYN